MKKTALLTVACMMCSMLFANHWVPETGSFQFYMALTSVIQIDGVEQASDQLEVGAFCGDQCRGSRMAEYWSFPPVPELSRYVVYLQVFGNEGDQITFKLYDHSTNQELDLISPYPIVWAQTTPYNEINPCILNFTSPPITNVTIEAVANPVEAGTVTGAGEYALGSTCELTATANSGYEFQNWSLNSSIVSVDPVYSFTVTEGGSYVANFVDPSQITNHWVPETGSFQFYMALTSIIQIDGVEQASDLLEVGAFCGDQCRGSRIAEYWEIPNLPEVNRYVVYLQVFGNEGDQITFKLYDHRIQQELDLNSPAPVTWVQTTNYNELNPCVLNFTSSATQTFTLPITGYGESAGGYYLIAPPIDDVNPEHIEGMVTGDFDLYYFDQAESDEWRNYEAEPFHLASGKGYLYAHKTNVTLSFTGMPYSGNGQVTLSKIDGARFAGWNLVGNPFAQAATIDRDCYVMKDDGTEIIAVTTRTVNPMQGIFVIAATNGEAMTFVPENTSEQQASLVVNVSQNRSAALDRAIIRFEGNGTLPKFMINPDNTKLYVTNGDTDYAVVGRSDDNTTPVSFKASCDGSYTLSFDIVNLDLDYLHLVDSKTGADVDLLQSPFYTFEARTTDYAERFSLVYATTTGIDEAFAYYMNGEIRLFEAVDGAMLQVVDMKGRVVASREGEAMNCVSTSGMTQGVYVLRLINGDDVKVQKIVIK